MSDDERDDRERSSDQETGANDWQEPSEPDPQAESEQTGFLVDESGDVEVVETDDPQDGSDEGIGGPEQDFGGIFSNAPFRGRERFQLTEPPFWSRSLRLLLLIGGIFYVGSVLPDVLMQGLSWWGLVELIGLPLIAALAVAYRAWKVPDQGLEIVFDADGLRMPKGADNPSYVDIDFHDLRSLVVMARGDSELVVIETESSRFIFSDGDFREPNGPRLLKDEIMRRVQNHPDGRAIVDRMEALEDRAKEASRNSTPVMYGLVGMVLAGYVIELWTGALSSQFGLVQLGANSAPLIAEGQWWRLISGNFLHGGFLHIFLNGLALFFLGMYIERLIGSWRFAAIYLVSAIGGALGSFWWTEAPLSVGASTALYGLVGAFGVLHVKYWREIPPPYRQTVQWWVVILGLNIGLSVLIPQIDAAAHFAGMGVGVLATLLVLVDMPDLRPSRDSALVVKILAGALTAVFAAGLGMAWNYAQYDHPGDRTTVFRYMVDQAEREQNSARLNRTAWSVAIDDDATSRQLDVAREAVETAIEMVEEDEDGAPDGARLAYRDTLATITYRLAMKADDESTRRERFAEAIEIERDVLRASRERRDDEESVLASTGEQDRTHRSQLARFLDAYHEEFGRYEVGDGLSEETTLELEARRESLALSVDLPTRAAARTELIGLAYGDGERLGAFRVCLPADHKGGIVDRFGPDHWSTGLAADSHVELVFTDTDRPMCDGDEPSVAYWPTAPEVRDWP